MDEEKQAIIASMVYVIESTLRDEHHITMDDDGRDVLYQHTTEWVENLLHVAIRALAFGEVPGEPQS